MKRLLLPVTLATLVITGCTRSPATSSAGSDETHPASKIFPVEAAGAPVAFRPETHDLVPSEEVPLLEQINRENTRVVNAALPGVVRIIASRPADPRMRFFGGKIPFELPFGGHGHPEAQPDDAAYSSGVILSRNGYILTNNHAVSDFINFEVELHNKQTFRARLVAADDLVDVAILKIDATDLTPLPWGDSDKVQVGEQVFAIGNPFDLADSVSKGIVSAKGRNIPQSEQELPHYEDFIQTDAAINPGNSGGALINIHGEMVGLNAAIASTTRLSMGIGFAIPSNLVRYAVEGLFKEGHLVRGYLGVVLPDSVDDGVVSQLNLKSSEGALLADIQPDSPAARANLHPFDFITAVDSHKIDSEAGLRLVVAQLPIGKQVQVDFMRDGKPQSTTVQIEEMKPDGVAESESDIPANDGSFPIETKAPPAAANVLGGLQVTDLNDKSRKKFAVDGRVASGVVVTGVQEGSMSELKGIQRGDVIESFSINRGTSQGVTSAKKFTDLTGALKSDQGVVLLVFDNQTHSSFIYLAPPAK